MVAIVTGNGLGLERSSAFVLGSKGQLGSSTFGRFGESVTVNAATGNLMIGRTDEILIGQGPDAVISRAYNSLDSNSGFGTGDSWRLNVQRRVTGLTGTVNTAGSTVKLIDWDGSDVVFTYDASKSAYVSKEGDGAYDTLSWTGGDNEQWDWTDGNSRMWDRFNGSGQLLNSTDASYKQLTYTYTGNNLTRVTVTDATGTAEYIDLTWSGNNITQMVTTKQGGATVTRTRYGYDGSGRLSTVTTDLSPTDNSIADNNKVVTTYTYSGTSNRIASIAQTGGALLSITYDGSNRVSTIVQTMASGVTNSTTFTYNSGNTTITDQQGQVTTLTYDANKQLTQVTLPAAQSGATAQTLSFTYNSNGDVLTTTDGSGNVTTYTYDANGNATLVRDQAGNTIARTYDATNHLLTETRYFVPDPDGAGSGQPSGSFTARYAYTFAGDLHFAVSGLGEVTEYVRNFAGQVTSTKVYRGSLYNISGLSASTAISESSLNSWVTGISDKSLVQRADTVYDFRGNISTVTSFTAANSSGTGLTTSPYSVVTYTYDQYGNLLTRQTTGYSGTGTTYTYNTEAFVYDGLARVTSHTDMNGTTGVAYTDASNQMVATLASGLVQTSVYNLAGELINYAQSGSGITTGTTAYAYDATGQLRMVTDATGNKTYYLYDYVGRKVADIAADGSITEYRYDKSDRLISSTSYATKLTTTQLNSLVSGGQPANVLLSAVRPSSNSADVWNWRIYDTANRLIETIDGTGHAVIFVYDGASNLVKTTEYATVIASGTVTGYKTTAPTTLQTPTADANHDIVTRNFYDNDSRLIGTLDGNGYLSQIKYNEAGEKVETIAFATITAAANRANGTFATLLADVGNVAADIHNRYVYDGEGNLKYTLDNNLRPTEYFYDGAGHVLHTVSYAGPIVSAPSSYTVANVASKIAATSGLAANVNNRISWAVYDSAGRVAFSIDANGDVTKFTYNAVGQVIKQVAYSVPRSTSSDPSLATMNSWVTSNASSTNDRVTRFLYDVAGRLVYTVDAENYVTESRYDTAGRLTLNIRYISSSYTINDSTTVSGLAGQIGSIPATAVQTSFVYDVDGRVTDTTDGAGIVTHVVYDALGRVTDRTVAHGTADAATTHFTYDAAGRVASKSNAYGTSAAVTFTYTYDGLGQLVTETNAHGGVTSYTYDNVGHVKTIVTPIDVSLSATVANVYDAFGHVIRTTDELGNNSYFFYDSLGRLAYQINQEGYTTKTEYTIGNEVSKVTHYATKVTGAITAGTLPTITTDAARDQVTTFTRDLVGQLTVTTRFIDVSNSAVTTNVYNAFGDVIQLVDARNNTTTYTYDKLGHVKVATAPLDASNSAVTTEYYDAFGNVIRTTDPRGNDTYFFYDKNNRLTHQIDQEGYVTKTSYNARGEVVQITRYVTKVSGAITAGTLPTITADAVKDEVTTFTRDLLGRIVTTTTAINATTSAITSNTYDAYGNVLTTTNSLGGVTTNVYDLRGLLIQESKVATSAAPAVTNKYEYDARGNRTKMMEAFSRPEQRTTNYSYDKLDRLTARASGDLIITVADDLTNVGGVYPSVTYQYDNSGNLILTTDEVGAKTYFYYDNLGRKTLTINALGTVSSFGYDANGNVTTQKVYEAPITLPSTAGGTPPTPTGAYRQTNYAYDKANRLTTTTVAGVQYGYWNGSSFVLNTADLVITNNYDKNGNIISQQDARGNNVFYYYDKRGMKIAQVDQGKYLTSYTLDANGNVTKEERFATALSTTPTTASDPAALKSSVSGNVNDRITNFTYDRNGHRLTEQRQSVNNWALDSFNNLIGSTANATITYTYNGLGEVTSKTEATGDKTSYVYDVYGRQTTVNGQGYTDYSGASVTPTTVMSYDGLNNLTSTVANSTLVSTNTYGPGGRLDTSTDASGFTTSYGYDRAGRVVKQSYTRTKSDDTNVTEARATRYDLLGRATYQGVATQNGSSWVFGDYQTTSYNAFGEVTGTGLNGLTQETNTYDNAGRATQTTAGDGISRTRSFDQNGNLTREVAPDGNGGTVTTYKTYDARGQNLAVVEPQRQLNATTIVDITRSRSYNAFGEVTQDIDGRGSVTNYSYNTVGKLTQTQNPLVSVTGENGVSSSVTPLQKNYYDLSGRVIAVEDANGNITKRLLLAGTGYGGSEASVLKEFHPDSGIKTFGYDVFGRQRKVTDELGKVTLMDYDAMGRLTTLTHPTRAANTPGNATGSDQTLIDYFLYDGLGQRIAHWNDVYGPSVRDKTDYDVQGRVIQTIDMADHKTTMSYGWDASISTVLYGGGSLGTFGGWNQVTQKWDSPSSGSPWQTSSVKVDYFNRSITKTDFGNNTTSYKYNLAGKLADEVVPNTAANTSEHIEYRYYNTGNLKSIDDITTSYSYVQTGHTVYAPTPSMIFDGGTYQDNGSYFSGQFDLWFDSQTCQQEHNYYNYYQDYYITYTYHTNGYSEVVDTYVYTEVTSDRKTSFDYDQNNNRTAERLSVSGGTYTDTTTVTDTVYGPVYHYYTNHVIDSKIRTPHYDYVGQAPDGPPILDGYERVYGEVEVPVEEWDPCYGSSCIVGYTYEWMEHDVPHYYQPMRDVYSYYTTDDESSSQDPHYTVSTGSAVLGHNVGHAYGYTQTGISLENETITYDAMNRVVDITDSGYNAQWPITLHMEYDANGNVRRRLANFVNVSANGDPGGAGQKDYWYKYDNMNRFVTTMGTLSGGQITRGQDGFDITYDAAGNRATSTDTLDDGTTSNQEIYTYTADGFLARADRSLNGATATKIAEYQLDRLGRATIYKEFVQVSGNTTQIYQRTAAYDQLSQVTSDYVYRRLNAGTPQDAYYYSDGTYDYTDENGHWYGGLLLHSHNQNNSSSAPNYREPSTDTTNSYAWRDSAILTSTVYLADALETVLIEGHYNSCGCWCPDTERTYGSNIPWITNYTYNALGHLTKATINDGQPRTITYVNNQLGEVLTRDVLYNSGSLIGPHERHYYLAGTAIGDVTNNGTSKTDYVASIAARAASNPSVKNVFNPTVGRQAPEGYGPFRGGGLEAIPYADFDQNYDPINGSEAGGTASNYQVHVGDTLHSIAQAMWGDSSLWYLIAQANGVDNSTQLQPGQNLIIPNNKIHNFHNSSSTFKVYDPNVAFGDTAPNAPEIPQPIPPPRKKGCGILGQILKAIITIAVTIITLPLGPVAAAMLGNLAGQAFGMATGIQKGFSWKELGMAAVTAGVGWGLDKALPAFGAMGAANATIGEAIVHGAVVNAVSQGIGVATGLQSKFDWTGVAVAGAGAGFGNFVSNNIGGAATGVWGTDTYVKPNAFNTAVSGSAGVIASAATRSLIDGSDFGDNIIAALPSVAGTIANAYVGQVSGWFKKEPTAQEIRMKADGQGNSLSPEQQKYLEERRAEAWAYDIPEPKLTAEALAALTSSFPQLAPESVASKAAPKYVSQLDKVSLQGMDWSQDGLNLSASPAAPARRSRDYAGENIGSFVGVVGTAALNTVVLKPAELLLNGFLAQGAAETPGFDGTLPDPVRLSLSYGQGLEGYGQGVELGLGVVSLVSGIKSLATSFLAGIGAETGVLRVVNPKNLRPIQGPEEMTGSQIKRLSRDMRANGYNPNYPIEAAKVDGRLIITDGHHRTEAAMRAGLSEVPVKIIPVTPQRAAQLSHQAAEAAALRAARKGW